MRVVKEVTRGDIRVSIFSWNSKYIFKYELGPMEQTFKVSETDILEEAELDGFLEGEFLEEVNQRFKEMGASLLRKIG
ncbi:MAG: hypothetical protein LW824_21210 [Algoriphagus sp.]|jgi:hypothetical protein|nr:hypothetical protein [Algoriphagus sp.]